MQWGSVRKHYEKDSKSNSRHADQHGRVSQKCPRKQSKVVTFYVASYWFSVAQQVVPGLVLAVPELFRG